MKNTLAENMLRFAPKNLKANDIKTLKRLAEQTADPKSILYYNPQPIAKVPQWNVGGGLESDSWMQLQFGQGKSVRNWLLAKDVTVCSVIGGSGIYSPHFVATNKAMSFAGDILESNSFIAEAKVFLVSTDAVDSTTKNVVAQNVPPMVLKIQPTVQGTLLEIGKLVSNKKDSKAIRAAAQLIVYINQFSIYTFDDYKTPSLAYGGKTPEQYITAGLQQPGIVGLDKISLV
jgi:hypothetical protein